MKKNAYSKCAIPVLALCHIVVAQTNNRFSEWLSYCHDSPKLRQSITQTVTKDTLWTPKDTEMYWSGKAEQYPYQYPFADRRRLTTATRFSNSDAVAGEGILSAFGSKYLPNAYALYQKTREKAKEKEMVLSENFPDGKKSDSTGGKLYEKICGNVARAIAEMDRRHDELCHYYLLHRAGIVTDTELKKIDSAPINIVLTDTKLPINPDYKGTIKELTTSEMTFARKNLPNAFDGYTRLKRLLNSGRSIYYDLYDVHIKMDAVCGGLVLRPIAEYLIEVRYLVDTISNTITQQKLLYNVEEVSADQLFELDKKMGLAIQAFMKKADLRDYVRTWFETNWAENNWGESAYFSPVHYLNATMVTISSEETGEYKISKYPVTDGLWEAIMKDGNKYFPILPNAPKTFALGHGGSNLYYAEKDIKLFFERLNEIPEIKNQGLRYRLPTGKEWLCAYRAGSTGEYCKLASGREITKETLEEVAGYPKNSNWFMFNTHWTDRNRLPIWVTKSKDTLKSKGCPQVGQKLPNAFGLYDMSNFDRLWNLYGDLDGELRMYELLEIPHDTDFPRYMVGDPKYDVGKCEKPGEMMLNPSESSRDDKNYRYVIRLVATPW